MRKYIWGNWAATWCVCSQLACPRDKHEALQLVRFAWRRRIKLRLLGALHSWNPLGQPSLVQLGVSTLHFTHLQLKTDKTVRVGVGVRIGPLLRFLASHGLQLATQWPNFGQISVGGAIAASANQHARNSGSISDSLLAVEYITPSGIHTASLNSPHQRERRIGRALAASFGNVALVTSVTLATRPLTMVCRRTKQTHFHHVLDALQSETWLTSSDYLEIWWNPYSDLCVVIRSDDISLAGPTDEPPRQKASPCFPPFSPCSRKKSCSSDCPVIGPIAPRPSLREASRQIDEFIDNVSLPRKKCGPAHEIFTDLVVPPETTFVGQPIGTRPAAEAEYSVSAKRVVPTLVYLRRVFLELAETIQLSRPVQIETVGRDRIPLITPARYPLNMFINIDIRQSPVATWKPFFNQLQAALYTYFRGRPNLGKYIHLTSKTFRKLYGKRRTAQFLRVMNHLHGDILYRTWS